MSSELTEKIRLIREAETTGRDQFSKMIGVPKKTLESIELSGRAPKGDMLEAICKIWPKYTLWLMTGMTDEKTGQVKPEIFKSENFLNSEKDTLNDVLTFSNKTKNMEVILEEIGKLLREVTDLFEVHYLCLQHEKNDEAAWERRRKSLSKKLNDKINASFIYLPTEMRALLNSYDLLLKRKPMPNNEIRRPIVNDIGEDRLDFLLNECMTILGNMVSMYYDMCSYYISYGIGYDFSKLFDKYEFDEDGNYNGDEISKRLCWCLLMYAWEYEKDYVINTFEKYKKESGIK